MRLASFNLLHGRAVEDGTVDGHRLGSAIHELDADVVAIQEVDRAQRRSGLLDLTEIVATAVGAADFRFEPALVGTPGGSWRPATAGEHGPSTDPMYGIGLATRFPVQAWHRVSLAPAPIRAPILVPGERYPIFARDEPRVILAAVLRVPGGVMTVATTHLSFVPGWNIWHLRQGIAFLRGLPAPRILLGDLNLPALVAARVSGWRSLLAVATYPASRPRIQFDHALGHGGVPTVVAGRAAPMPLSDHRALVVDLADRPDILH